MPRHDGPAPGRPTTAPRRPRVPVWVFVVVFWVLLTVIYVTQVALMVRPPGEAAMLWTQLTWQSIYYLAWAPVTLLIWRMTSHWELEALGWSRFLLRHALFGLFVGVVHGVAVVLVATMARPLNASEPWSMLVVTYVRARLHTQLLIYAAIVGTGQAISFRERYRERQVAAAQLEAQLTAARLDTLRAQLQPHFLFNSLHSIAALARAGDTAGVVRLISGFSELLRHLLDSNATHHSVGEELSLVDRYLDIQRVRFGDRLRITIDAPADVLEARIPLLVVQPLVENALRHGLANRIDPGHVHVQARRDGRMLVIEVSDDGVGLPGDWTLGSGPGTGLKNLATRLAAEFGGEQCLSVETRSDGGVRATVDLPFTRA